MLSGRIIGLAVGLVLGIVWMWLGFGPALLTGFLGLVGAAIGSVAGAVSRGRSELLRPLERRARTASYCIDAI